MLFVTHDKTGCLLLVYAMETKNTPFPHLACESVNLQRSGQLTVAQLPAAVPTDAAR